MPEYKLIYFNARGRAEMCRLLFALADISYEDTRVTMEEWSAMKPNTKFGQLPLLEIDGKSMSQSRAVLMYLGRTLGYYPSSPEDAYKVDEILFIMEDYMIQAGKAFFVKDEEKEEKMKEYKEVQVPKFHKYLEILLKENKDGQGYFVGDEITVADISVFDWVSNNADSVGDFPLLEAFMKRFGSLEKIKKWVDTRPKTTF